jgi:PTH1 family peptidyl-tRNA hydrolase
LKIVLGLGNPGARYRSTRHNVGFRVLDSLAARAGVVLTRHGELGSVCLSGEAEISGTTVVLAKPTTYMNRSGRAGAALLARYGASPPEILVVHDDADLLFGRVRIRAGGSGGGHNGLRSLISVFKTIDFPRVKLGVRGARRADTALEEYVLAGFDDDETEAADDLVELGADAVSAVIGDGLSAAMNRFNGIGKMAETPEAC